MEGQNREQSERAGRATNGDDWVVMVGVRGGGSGVTTNLLHFTDTKEKGERKGEEEEARESHTAPAILFLSSAATAFVAMTTQADDLIAVASEWPFS